MIPEQTIEYRYDTQLLIDGYEDLDEDEVFDYIASNFDIVVEDMDRQARGLQG